MSYKQIKLNALDFKNSLKKVKDYMCNKEAHPYICGVYFENHDKLKLVATNGFALIINEPEYNITKNGKGYDVIIPAEAVKALIALIDKKYYEDEIKIIYDGNKIEFKFCDVTYGTLLVEGSFPDYAKVIPQETIKILNSFNPNWINITAKTFGNLPMSIWATEDVEKRASSPHIFKSSKDLQTTCVLMPMNDTI